MVLSPSKRHRTKQAPMLAERRSSKLCQAVCDISFDGHIFIPHMFICKHQIVYSNKIMSQNTISIGIVRYGNCSIKGLKQTCAHSLCGQLDTLDHIVLLHIGLIVPSSPPAPPPTQPEDHPAHVIDQNTYLYLAITCVRLQIVSSKEKSQGNQLLLSIVPIACGATATKVHQNMQSRAML